MGVNSAASQSDRLGGGLQGWQPPSGCHREELGQSLPSRVKAGLPLRAVTAGEGGGQRAQGR